MATKYQGDRHWFTGVDDRLYCIKPLSATSLIDLVDYLNLLGEAIDADLSFGLAYATIPEARECCNSILRLCGLQPSVVPIDLLAALLFKQEGSPYPKGILHHVNKLDQESTGKGESTSLEEYRVNLCVGLVNVGLSPDIAAAEKVVDTMPLPFVESAIASRAEALKDPKERKKEDMFAKAKEAALNSDLGDFGGFQGPLKVVA